MNSVYTSLRGFILELFTLEADCKSLVDLGAWEFYLISNLILCHCLDRNQ